jgi:RHS repeat-associated protein
VRVVVDTGANVVESYDYYPFGAEQRSRVNANQNAGLRFTGKELDKESHLGLYYFGARYYDPEVGRFLSVDPLADKYPGLTPYHYCDNNPLNALDPDGKAFNLLAAGIGAAVGGLVGGGINAFNQISTGTKFEDLNWKDITASAAGGATAGGLAGLTMGGSLVVASGASAVTGTFLQGAIVAGGASVIGGAVERELDSDFTTKGLDSQAAAKDFSVGAIGGGAGAVVGNFAKGALKEAARTGYKNVGVKVTSYFSKKGAEGVAIKQNMKTIISSSTAVGTAFGETSARAINKIIDNDKNDNTSGN